MAYGQNRVSLYDQAQEMKRNKERDSNLEEYGIHENHWERKLRIEKASIVMNENQKYLECLIEQFKNNEFLDWGIKEIELIKFLLEYKQELIFVSENYLQ